MSVDRAFKQLHRANPVPNPAALRKELRDDAQITTTRSSTMDTTTTESPTPPKTPRRWAPGMVAAALVLVLGVSSVIVLTDGTPFASSEPTPVEVAEAFMVAIDSYDAEVARRLLAADVRTPDDFPYVWLDPDQLDSAVEMHRSFGFRITSFDCDQQTQPGSVRCAYAGDSRLQQIVGYPPIETQFNFLITDGLITWLDDGFPLSEWASVASPFMSWLEAEHSGVADSLFLTITDLVGTELALPRLTPETVELVPVYLDLYEEWLDSQEG